jgi:hypothetical protein
MVSRLRSLGTVGLLLAILFTLVAGAQYGFLKFQLHERTKSNLLSLAEDMREQIAFGD